MKKPVSRFALIALVLFWGGWIAFTAPSTATMPIQKKAKELGFPADNCLYCHNEKLPKKGAITHNTRGGVAGGGKREEARQRGRRELAEVLPLRQEVGSSEVARPARGRGQGQCRAVSIS